MTEIFETTDITEPFSLGQGFTGDPHIFFYDVTSNGSTYRLTLDEDSTWTTKRIYRVEDGEKLYHLPSQHEEDIGMSQTMAIGVLLTFVQSVVRGDFEHLEASQHEGLVHDDDD